MLTELLVLRVDDADVERLVAEVDDDLLKLSVRSFLLLLSFLPLQKACYYMQQKLTTSQQTRLD